MPVDFAIGDTVRQLRRVGIRPGEKLVSSILRAGEAAYHPLLELATTTDLLHEDEPDCFGPLHALRMLGELPRVEMIEPLYRQLPLSVYYEEEQLPRLWTLEAPQIVGRLGLAAIEPLWAMTDNEAYNESMRATAMATLSYAVTTAPEARDAVVAQLRERLTEADVTTWTAFVVATLCDLGVQDVYRDVMALYREGRVDTQIIPASAARQMLMSGGNPHLRCVNHTLWERYDEHGPKPEDG